MARYCNKCNSLIEDGGYFCTECGSNDTRDEEEEKRKLEEEKKEIEKKEDTSKKEIESIPEINPVSNSLANSIKPVSNSMESDPIPSGFVPEEKEAPSLTAKEDEKSENKNSFADVPDFMNADTENAPQEIKVPSDFHLKDGGTENDYSQPSNINQMDASAPIKKTNQKKKSTIIGIIVFLIVVVAFFGGYFYLKSSGTEIYNPFTNSEIFGGNATGRDVSSYFTDENSNRFGQSGYGYLSIPKAWTKVSDLDSNKTMKFTDGVSWIVTMYGVPTKNQSATDWANSMYHTIENGGGTNLSTGNDIINGYKALTVTAYYPSQKQYLSTWFFEDKSGTTHYLAIEGPEEDNDYYNIIYSFKENE